MLLKDTLMLHDNGCCLCRELKKQLMGCSICSKDMFIQWYRKSDL